MAAKVDRHLGYTLTPLAQRLQQVIATEGPISVARYMDLCLNDPVHGYYRTSAPIGARGDFVTAPEISQMFGELIGLWCAVTWRQMGTPTPLRLVELGPGRGTLMKDALRGIATEPLFHAALTVHLVETGNRLRATQVECLAGQAIEWHENLSEVPEGPILLIANEFFDTLPIHQYERTDVNWHERLVTSGKNGFTYILATKPSTLDRLGRVGDVFEQAPARLDYMADIAARIEAGGGAALIIDYGHGKNANGDTLQAVRAHKTQPVFAEPGLTDLTSHVDFQALARTAAHETAVHGPVRQGKFLRTLGIETRAALLQRDATPANAHDIESALRRLTDSQQMGDLFKVLALTVKGAPVPAGFENLVTGGRTW